MTASSMRISHTLLPLATTFCNQFSLTRWRYFWMKPAAYDRPFIGLNGNFDAFLANVSILRSLKTPKKLCFTGVLGDKKWEYWSAAFPLALTRFYLHFQNIYFLSTHLKYTELSKFGGNQKYGLDTITVLVDMAFLINSLG